MERDGEGGKEGSGGDWEGGGGGRVGHQRRALSPRLYCFAQKWQKSFTEQPGRRRRRLRVPEEVVTTGMSDSERRQSDRQTAE